MSARFTENDPTVFVDWAAGNDQFAVMCDGVCWSLHEDILRACDAAEALAETFIVPWGVTLQARNQGNMS